MKEAPISFLPLSSASVYILLSLADEPRHGYGIMQEIARLSGQQYKIGPGTLYDNLEKLIDNGMVGEPRRPPANSDPRRRYYELSSFGRQVLAADIERLKTLTRQATLRLNGAPARVPR